MGVKLHGKVLEEIDRGKRGKYLEYVRIGVELAEHAAYPQVVAVEFVNDNRVLVDFLVVGKVYMFIVDIKGNRFIGEGEKWRYHMRLNCYYVEERDCPLRTRGGRGKTGGTEAHFGTDVPKLYTAKDRGAYLPEGLRGEELEAVISRREKELEYYKRLRGFFPYKQWSED